MESITSETKVLSVRLDGLGEGWCPGLKLALLCTRELAVISSDLPWKAIPMLLMDPSNMTEYCKVTLRGEN